MYEEIFSKEVLQDLLPPQRADEFFEALYGDAAEGAYNIGLAFRGHDQGSRTLAFELHLRQRPEKCLACNLTFGLPEVFSRHPLLNIGGVVKKLATLLGPDAQVSGWELGRTETPADDLHIIPLKIRLG
jgi:hypothetical protein